MILIRPIQLNSSTQHDRPYSKQFRGMWAATANYAELFFQGNKVHSCAGDRSLWLPESNGRAYCIGAGHSLCAPMKQHRTILISCSVLRILVAPILQNLYPRLESTASRLRSRQTIRQRRTKLFRRFMNCRCFIFDIESLVQAITVDSATLSKLQGCKN